MDILVCFPALNRFSAADKNVQTPYSHHQNPMSWPDVFPVFSEKQIDEFYDEASSAEKGEGVERVINPQPEAREIVSVSLFWKKVQSGGQAYPEPTREILQNAVELGDADRFNPWEDTRKANVLRAQQVENLQSIHKELAHFHSPWIGLFREDALLCHRYSPGIQNESFRTPSPILIFFKAGLSISDPAGDTQR